MKKQANIALIILISLWNASTALADINDGLAGYWPFNGNAYDESGNGNHASVNQPTLTEDRFSNPNSAYDFDGDDRMVVLSSDSLNPVDQLTIAFWIKVNSTTNEWSPIIHKGGSKQVSGAANREYTVWLNEQPYFLLTSAGDGSEQHVLYSDAVRLGEWIFYTAVIDRRNHFMKVYINGVLDVQMSDSYSSFNNNDYDLEFGGRGEGLSVMSPFNGVLDDIRIYTRALSESEIVELFGGEVPPPPGQCTKAEIDAAYEQGRQACIANPSSCGIDSADGAHAIFEPSTGELHIPFVEVPGAFGTTQTFDVYLMQKPLTFTFDLDMDRIRFSSEQ